MMTEKGSLGIFLKNFDDIRCMMSDANNQLNKFGKSFWVGLKIDF